MSAEPKVFKDKNGNVIAAGDVLFRRFICRWRERPGHKRVAIESMSGREVIVSDEGGLRDAQEHWVKYYVKWAGACLIAKRGECSDFQALTQAEKFDEKGKSIHEGSGFHYLNDAFDSTVYEVVVNDQQIEGAVGIAVNHLAKMTDEQRTDVFSFFCTQCGAPDPRCQCCNDE